MREAGTAVEATASNAVAGGRPLNGSTGSALEALRRHSRQIAARRVRRVQVCLRRSPRSRARRACHLPSAICHAPPGVGHAPIHTSHAPFLRFSSRSGRGMARAATVPVSVITSFKPQALYAPAPPAHAKYIASALQRGESTRSRGGSVR